MTTNIQHFVFLPASLTIKRAAARGFLAYNFCTLRSFCIVALFKLHEAAAGKLANYCLKRKRFLDVCVTVKVRFFMQNI